MRMKKVDEAAELMNNNANQKISEMSKIMEQFKEIAANTPITNKFPPLNAPKPTQAQITAKYVPKKTTSHNLRPLINPGNDTRPTNEPNVNTGAKPKKRYKFFQ